LFVGCGHSSDCVQPIQSRRISHEENNNGYQCGAGRALRSCWTGVGMDTHLIVIPYDSLNLVDNKIVLPGGTKDTLAS
jgi:hypothetical protein